jgi:hypothetical protein
MPSLSGSFNPKIGPLVALFVTPPAVLAQRIQGAPVPAAQIPFAPAGQPAVPEPPATPPSNAHVVHATMALIDSGASITSVTAALASQVGLPLLGRRQLGTAGGTIAVNAYLADIGIPFGLLPQGPVGQPLQTSAPAAILANRIVLEFKCTSPHFQMLLGRDILCSGIFHMSFDGRFSFSL